MASLAAPAVGSFGSSRKTGGVAHTAATRAIAKLTQTLFRRGPEQAGAGGKTLLITSARRREGVSTITQMIAAHLAGELGAKTLLLLLDQFDQIASLPVAELDLRLSLEPGMQLWTVSRDPRSTLGLNEQQIHAARIRTLAYLRERFDCILLDSPALEESDLTLRVAPLATGVLLVVAAGSTSGDEVRLAHRELIKAGAVVAGCCLNRRRYPLPAFIYRWFGR